MQLDINSLKELLTASLAPVALISGIGLLLLSMTNRLGRTIDRARAIAKDHRNGPAAEQIHLATEIRFLYRRSRLLRLSITFATCAIFGVSLIIATICFGYLTQWDIARLVVAIYILSLGSLIIGLALFIRDLTLTLEALKVELRDWV